jgi:hypothetical protein
VPTGIVKSVERLAHSDDRFVSTNGRVKEYVHLRILVSHCGRGGRPNDRSGVEEGGAVNIVHFDQIAQKRCAGEDVRFGGAGHFGHGRAAGGGDAAEPVEEVKPGALAHFGRHLAR